MEKDKQKVPDAIRLLTMKVIDKELNSRVKPKDTIYGCWYNQNDIYFSSKEELEAFRQKNQLVVFPTFKVEYYGNVVDFTDILKISSLYKFKGVTIYSPSFEEYDEKIVEELEKTKKINFLYGDISLNKIYRKLQETGTTLEAINEDWLLKEQVAILEEKIGSSVSKAVDNTKAPHPKITPLATIYGYQTYDYEQKWFFSKEEFDSFYPAKDAHPDYTVIEFFGNVSGCKDVMKINVKCPHAYELSGIYTPTFDKFNFPINNSVQLLGIGKQITFFGEINLNTIYDLLTENGINVETDYKNSGKKEGSSLVKKQNKVTKPINQ